MQCLSNLIFFRPTIILPMVLNFLMTPEIIFKNHFEKIKSQYIFDRRYYYCRIVEIISDKSLYRMTGLQTECLGLYIYLDKFIMTSDIQTLPLTDSEFPNTFSRVTHYSPIQNQCYDYFDSAQKIRTAFFLLSIKYNCFYTKRLFY